MTGPPGSSDRSLLVIGGGIAGLSMGCYAQMNGYCSTVLEMHDKPGGLCTAWTRKGYTVDCCIHWLTGFRPGGSMYRLWEEIGLVRGLEIVNLDEFYRYEGEDGRTVVIHRDLERTLAHLCDLSPSDAPLVRELLGVAKKLVGTDIMADMPPKELMGFGGSAKMVTRMLPLMRPFRKWGPRSVESVAAGSKDPRPTAALRAMWPPEISAFSMLMTFAWLHEGSADGHATIYDLLGGHHVGEVHRDLYERGVPPPFTSLLFVVVGVDAPFTDLPRIVTGIDLPMAAPLEAGGRTYTRLHARVHNFDRVLASEDKTAITCMLAAE